MKSSTLLSVVALSSVFSFAQGETASASVPVAENAQEATVEAVDVDAAAAEKAVAAEESGQPDAKALTESANAASAVAQVPAVSPEANGEPKQAENVVEAAAEPPAGTVVDSVTATAVVENLADAAKDTLENTSAALQDSVVAQQQRSAEMQDSLSVSSAEEPVNNVAATSVSDHEIQGNIQGFISVDKSPYLVTGDLVVAPNTAVIIEPGVVFQFKRGTGLTVNNGQLVVAGTAAKPVVFKAAGSPDENLSWKGLAITGDPLSEIRNAQFSDATAAVVIENGNVNLQSVKISSSTSRGVYARNSKLVVRDCEFVGNKGAALHLGNYAEAEVERSKFSKNNVAVLNSELAQAVMTSSHFDGNEYGLVALKNSQLFLNNTKVQKNKVGASSEEILDSRLLESISNNQTDYNSNALAMVSSLPADPEIQGVERRPLVASDKIGVLAKAGVGLDSTKTGWNVLGNVMFGGNFHYVQTRKNHGSVEVIGKDTVKNGDRYKNVFQVPGFGGEAAAYVMMQSSDGKTIEFNADLTVDSWNHFSPNPVTLSYRDDYNYAVIGDMHKTGGNIYMSGLSLFGADYTLSLFKNNADEPLFQLNGFFGEAKRSMVPGERHPYIYKTYIEDGTAQAQRLAYGGSLKWAPLRRFDAKIGAIYANDEIKDPLLRDGASSRTNTIDPMVESFTMYADGNWLFFPGDIELNGQIAVGRADTANVVFQRAMGRAIDEVIAEYGMPLTSANLLRELVQNRSKVHSLSREELSKLFENSNVSQAGSKLESELNKILDKLAARAKELKKEDEDDLDDSRVLGTNWGSQNFAIGASLDWNFYKTSISGHIKYVGEDFYSAGSPDELSDTREFGARIDQGLTSFWNMSLSYRLNVENAAKGGATNLFGLGEGTRWGLFPDKESSWFDKHELDVDRTRYTQVAGTQQTFNIGSRVELSLGYNFEFKKQYRNHQLHGDYMLEDNVYGDDWFAPRKGNATRFVVFNGDSVEVDSLRWTEYNALQGEPYLASKFHERIFKHTWNADVSVKAASSVFKIGGRWTIREDASRFYKDSLVSHMDLADTTWAKLGYYFNGANYFEQLYPVSVTTTLGKFQNRLNVTPRFKNYNRDDMKEVEVTVGDEMEIPMMNRFMILSLGAEYRYMITEWEEFGRNKTEEETDVLGDVKLRVNHSGHFYSEWNVGTALYYRPDNLSSQYKDLYCGINLNYVF